jgi:hypothetical protein
MGLVQRCVNNVFQCSFYFAKFVHTKIRIGIRSGGLNNASSIVPIVTAKPRGVKWYITAVVEGPSLA